MGLSVIGRVRRSHLYWHLLFCGVVLALLFAILRGLGQVLTPVAAALVLSYLLDPLVSGMERRLHLPRWLGTIILFLGATLALGAVLLVVLPVMGRELESFIEAVPGYAARLRDLIEPWLQQRFGASIPRSLGDVPSDLVAQLRGLASESLAPLGGVAGKLAQGTASFLSKLGTVLLVPVFLFYFLQLFPSMVRGAEDLIPRRYLPWIRSTAAEVDRVLAAWIRGQLTVMAALALFYSIGLTIVGLKMAVLIGVLAGFLAFIPYVGVIVGISLALLVALLEYHGPGQIVGVLAVFGLAQAADGLVLTPVLVGEKVGLGPVGVLIALMLGGSLFGFIGVLLAVPLAAALVVVLKRAVASYKASQFYRKGAFGSLTEQSAPPPPDSVPPPSSSERPALPTVEPAIATSPTAPPPLAAQEASSGGEPPPQQSDP